jgi:cytochrome oxidase Cu insertion factor (SCO1/SenC/PrrC family)
LTQPASNPRPRPVVRRPALLGGLLAAAVGIAALAGVIHTARQHPATHPAATTSYIGGHVPPGIRLPTFALHDYHGHLITSTGLHNKAVAFTFLDTACTTKCPITAAIIGRGMRRLTTAQRRNVAMLALTVDPRVDHPRSIHRFLRRRHALSAMDYLIGTTTQLTPIWKAFYVLAAVKSGHDDVHSSEVRIYNRRGIWVASLNVGADLTPQTLAHDLALAAGP